MIRRVLAVSAVAALTVGLIPAAAAAPDPTTPDRSWPRLESSEAVRSASLDKGPVLSLGEGSGRDLYIVRLDSDAVPTYSGGVDGLAPVQTKSREFTPDAPRERAYRAYVRDQQADLRSGIADLTGRAPRVEFAYTDALNGIAVELTRDEAREVAELDGVAAVQVDEMRQLNTDVGPEWIGAPSIWDGSATPSGTGTKGEGIVAGIIDSGLNAANPSFADVVPVDQGGDGFDHTNPRGAGVYVGACDPASPVFVENWGCNDKLIGAWDFDPRDDAAAGYGYDENGHGTHTASTTAGNQVEATTYAAEGTEDEFSTTETIKGVAPHANVIAYDVCAGGCPLTAIIAAIDQSIEDEVDVINYSIGSSAASNPWTDPDAVGFLNARAAGIHVATSAGNAGPGAATLGSPGDVPWLTTVGATQHNRQWQATVQQLTADGGATLPDISGLAFAAATDQPYPLVYAGDAPYDNPLCLADAFAADADFTGQIVVCDRGTSGRVEKGTVVSALGAEGMVLANDEASGDSLNADPHDLPAVHITFDDGTALKDWMATVTGEQASLSGGQKVVGPEVADIMAGFSSRGPNRAVEMISPSLSAPGVDVLAANGVANEVSWGFISGTSMASPHVAGSLALVAATNPGWTPAEAQSALMSTSLTAITDSDGTPADWFDMGSGRVDLTKAADAGLVLDITEEQYLGSDPAVGGDVKELNTASMADAQCLQTCSWTRTVEATETGAGQWTAEGSAVTDGITVSVSPSSFTLAAGETQEITVTADVTGAATDAYQFGNVVLTPAAGSEAPAAHLPVAALPSTGVIPAEIEIDTRRDAGSQESEPIEAVEITDLDIQANGLVPAESQQLSIPEDSTNDDPYDGNGTAVVDVTVPEGATRFIANLTDATAPDMDLYVGKGEVSAANQVAFSAGGTAAESVDIPLGEGDAGDWWILVQNWTASTPGGTDTVTLENAVVAGDEGNLSAEGPATQPLGEPFTIRAFWDEPDLAEGQTWYGSLTLDTAPGGTRIGTIPVTVNRLADDVTKTADTATAAPGDTITYTVDVAPNVTPEDLAYTISDQLPDGTTYVEGSATGGATHEGGVISWEGVMPSPFGVEKKYDVTTSATDASCVHPFSGTAEFVDLGGFGIPLQPAVEGDSVAFTSFAADSFGFYEETYDGLTFTDDGFLVYGDGYGGNPFINQEVPNPALPNNLAAALWQDMELLYDAGSEAGVRIAQAGDLKLVQFDKMRLAGDKSGRLGTTDYQVAQVAGSRDVYVAFGNVGGPVDDVTIGAENATGEAAQALVNSGDASSVIAADTVVCMRYSELLDPEQFSYQVTVDADVTDGQVLRNELTHEVDNPGAEPVVVVSEVTAEVAEETLPAIRVIKKRDAREPNRDGVVVFRRPAWATGERLTVEYRVGGTARPGKDYRRLDGVATFRRDSRTVREVIQVKNRKGRQGVRFVRIVITAGDGYEVGDPRAVRVRIRDARR